MSDLAEWLLTLEPAELATVLSARPDVLTEPTPRSTHELAERLTHPYSVAPAMLGLPLPVVQVAEATQALGDGCEAAQLAAALGREGHDEDVAAALDTLRAHALVWPEEELLRTAGLEHVWSHPLQLGAPAAPLLRQRTAAELRRIATALGLAPVRLKQDLVRDIANWLTDETAVRALVDTAPEKARQQLRDAAWHGPEVEPSGIYLGHGIPTVAVDQWAAEHGLLVGGQWGPLQIPAEVALALRGPDYQIPFDPEPPAPPLTEAAPEVVERESAAAGTAAERHVAMLLRQCARQPAALLKSGGVGVRELRRLAGLIGDTERRARFWLELCHAADLVAVGARQAAPTAGYDTWHAAEPAQRLATLLWGWQRMPVAPLRHVPEGKPPRVALAQSAGDPLVVDVRSRLLRTAGSLPEGAGAAADDAAALTAWRHPLLLNVFEGSYGLCRTLWQEAELLGVIAHGALTPLGRALVDDDTEAVVATARQLLPPAETAARFQGDLSAVVGGTPCAQLAALLDSAADRETRDTAATWRFTASTVRRAFDTGATAAGLLDALRSSAVGHTLPQPLEYLVKDVARRHGAIRVRQLTCCLRVADPALLEEVLAARSLASLELRRLAPTVLGSARTTGETLQALRAAGYAPIAEDADAAAVIERVPEHRAGAAKKPPPRRRPAARLSAAGGQPAEGCQSAAGLQTPPDLVEVAAALLAAGSAESYRDEPEGADLTVLAGESGSELAWELAHAAGQLTGYERRLLGHAIEAGVPVRIGYTNAQGNSTVRVVEDAIADGPLLHAWCTLRQDERAFALSRISSVSPA